ncbi:MAG: hypothetical protein WA635_14585 [Gallionella sp.]
MGKNPLFDLYEKLYFYEIEVREKLSSRLQAPLAIIVSLIGVLGFLMQNFDKQQATSAASLFSILLVASAISLSSNIYFFIRSWYGYTYEFLPTADDTEKYRRVLESTYKQFKDGNILAENYLNDYLCSYYIKCSTQHTRYNDLRSLYLHKTNGTLIITTLFVAVSFLTFFFGDLDKSHFIKPSEVVIVKPVDVKGVFMTDKKPEEQKEVALPPPPPPPPPRLIKEGVEIVKPQPEKKNGK